MCVHEQTGVRSTDLLTTGHSKVVIVLNPLDICLYQMCQQNFPTLLKQQIVNMVTSVSVSNASLCTCKASLKSTCVMCLEIIHDEHMM